MSVNGTPGKELVFKHTPGLMANELDGDTVVMSVESGAYYGIEGTGQAIWSLLAQPISVADLIERILERYQVDRALCEKQVLDYLVTLEKEGLIQRC